MKADQEEQREKQALIDALSKLKPMDAQRIVQHAISSVRDAIRDTELSMMRHAYMGRDDRRLVGRNALEELNQQMLLLDLLSKYLITVDCNQTIDALREYMRGGK